MSFKNSTITQIMYLLGIVFSVALVISPVFSDIVFDFDKVKPNDIGRDTRNVTDEDIGSDGVLRIINGVPVKTISAIPYQVGFLSASASNPNNQYWCGGSLISKRYVVTACHCVQGEGVGYVFLGYRDINNLFGAVPVGAQRIKVGASDYIPHAGFNRQELKDDIALIHLPEDAIFTKKVQPITINPQCQLPLVGKYTKISGWGLTKTGKQPTTLNRAFVPVISNQQCQKYYGAVITDTNICQGTVDDRGTCEGDSGGPMIYDLNNKRYLAGIVSFGPSGGCLNNAPRAFTRACKYKSWICTNTNNEVC